MEVLLETPLKLMLYLGNLFLSFSIFLFLMYLVQIQSMRSRTKKYKFVSEKERGAMQGTAILFAISMAFYAFILVDLSIGSTRIFPFIVAGLTAAIIGYLIGKVLWMYLSYYHPFILEKRLNDIRFNPMKSPKTGNEMTLLNEDQEDAHLSKEMIEEEDTLSVDYDVWLDEQTGDKVIERYDTRFHPLVCDSCNFRTLMERSVNIVQEPTQHEKGLLSKHYECTYCGNMELKEIDIPSWDEEKQFEKYEKDVVEMA